MRAVQAGDVVILYDQEAILPALEVYNNRTALEERPGNPHLYRQTRILNEIAPLHSHTTSLLNVKLVFHTFIFLSPLQLFASLHPSPNLET